MIKYDTENKGKTFMKKIYTILLVVAIMLVFLVQAHERAKAAFVGGANSIKIYLCGTYDPDGRDRTSWITSASDSLALISDATVNKQTAFNPTQIETYMKNANMLVVTTHGWKEKIKTVDSAGNVSYLTKSTVKTWATDSLSNLKILLLCAC